MDKQIAGSVNLYEVAVAVIALVGLYVFSRYSYPAFHTVAELFSIVIGFSLFMLIWNSRKIIDNNYLVLVGIAYFFIASIDLIHTLAYKGIELFSGYGTNLPTQLWIAARYVESLTLLIAPFYISRKLVPGRILAVYLVITLIILLAIFDRAFPDCYIEGVGLTPFKIISEYLISSILLVALIFLLKKRMYFDQEVLKLLVLSIITTIGSELFFTFYIGVFDISNLVGHYLKIISFFLIYKALIETGLSKPYHLMFRNLKEAETELQKQANLLEAANNELERFSYSVSHDLRQPLRVIATFSKMLHKDLQDKLDIEANRKFDVIQSNVKKMNQLIEAILSFSLLGGQALNLTIIDYEKLLAAVWQELREINPERKIEMNVSTMAACQGDEIMIKQVFSNLLSNALKFTKDREPARIKVGSEEKTDECVYYVKDNGIGFDMQNADKLFRLFHRLHSEDKYEGTGVGLTFVKRIIERHGGRIWAEAKVNEGAAFYFSLPKDPRQPVRL